jgi:YbbR domain-containing protein
MRIPGFRRLGLKIVSVALATLVWVLVAGEQIVERSLRIPLEFVNLPSQLELTGDTPNVVDVRVRGSSGVLGRVAAGELVAVIDLRSARAGQRLFHLTASDVRAPFGIDVVQVTPSNISMTFELSASKRVPIVPNVEGEPAQGFAVASVVVDPSMAEILGPVSALGSVMEAVTEPVSVSGARSTVTDTVNVGVSDPSLRLRSPQRAKVTVNVVPAR